MLRSLFTAATGMTAQQQHIDIISNNLANVNTTGFKRGRADFQDLLYQTLRQPGAASSDQTEIPTGIQLGLGVRTAAVQRLFLEGDFQQTQNQLDIAIDGAGFFQIRRPDGEISYSRAGSFKLDSQGRVVNSDGFPLEPEITIPNDAVSITVGTDGTVSVLQAGNTTAATGRPDPAGQFPQSCWPERAGAQSLSENDGFRRPHYRGAQPGWPGWAVTGSARNFQCQCGGRNGQSHYGAAGV